MFHYRVTIAYKGTHFRGWQAQSKEPLQDAEPTVQGTIHQALRKIAKYQACTISGCSRTDAGVHAKGQIGKISIPREISAQMLQRGLNTVLPGDIRILECSACAPEFNPKVGVTSREYHYYFSTALVASPTLAELVAHVPGPLDLARMREAARLFVGEHDFVNFYRRSSQAATTTRTLFACELQSADFSPLADAPVHYLRFVGSGFLKQMVRYMAGALFAVAREQISLADIARYLESAAVDKLTPKASANGLHLICVQGLGAPPPAS